MKMPMIFDEDVSRRCVFDEDVFSMKMLFGRV